MVLLEHPSPPTPPGGALFYCIEERAPHPTWFPSQAEAAVAVERTAGWAAFPSDVADYELQSEGDFAIEEDQVARSNAKAKKRAEQAKKDEAKKLRKQQAQAEDELEQEQEGAP